MKDSGIQAWDKAGKVFRLRVDIGKDASGHRKRHTEIFHGGISAARKRMTELRADADKGTFVEPSRMTVAEHLDAWLDGYVQTNCSIRTLEGYRSIIKHHLIPAFGSLKLKDLTPATITAYYGTAVKKLSNRTVHHQHRLLSESLKYAVRQGYLLQNPCQMVDPPTPHKKKMRSLTPAEAEWLLSNSQDSMYYPIIYTAISSGLRQAELLGLTWRNVDLDLSALSVTQVLTKRGGKAIFTQPKTEHSRRRVDMTTKLAVYLREYKASRESLYIQTGRILNLDDLLFTNVKGDPLNASVVSGSFHKLTLSAGIKGVRFHDLRHTFASLMLMRGANIKYISESLGHASVAFTMDVYSHIIASMQQNAMGLLNDVLPSGVSPIISVNGTAMGHGD